MLGAPAKVIKQRVAHRAGNYPACQESADHPADIGLKA